MLKESKPRSRSPTLSFYQHFKIPSNKPQYSRYRSRSYSNPYRRSSRDTRYRSRSYSRSHSRPRYNDKSHSLNYSSYYSHDRSRYDKHYNQNPHKSYSSSSRPYFNSTSSRSPSKYYPRSRERSSSYNNSSFKRYNSPYRPPSESRNDRYRSRSHSNSRNHSQFQYKPSINSTHPSIRLFKAMLLQNPNLKLICTNPLLLLHNTPHSPLNMLTLLHLQLGLLIYIFSNPMKIFRSLLN